jgi:Phosphatidylserine decarboxylase
MDRELARIAQPADILFVNERQINILDTYNFGCLGFVEVGALSVGRIVQVHPLDAPFQRGEEKSVFRFGGSAIAVFGEPGKWAPSVDLLAHTKDGAETFVRLGETIGLNLHLSFTEPDDMSAFWSLSGVKQTLPGPAKIDANDPRRTSASIECCSGEAGFRPIKVLV